MMTIKYNIARTEIFNTMKKFIPLLTIGIIAAAALTGCQKENLDEDPNSNQDFTVKASADGEIYPEFRTGDEIMVICADEVYTFSTEKGGKTADFKDTESRLTAEIIGNNPVSALFNCSNMYGTFRIQAEQTYGNGASSTAIPMYAYTMNPPAGNALDLKFKPLASIFRLVIQPYALSMDKLTIEPAEGASVTDGAMAGGYTVDAASGTVKVTNEINSVSVEFPSSMNLNEGATIDIPVGWFTVEGGLTLTVTYNGTQEYTSTIWQDGPVSSYTDNSGIKSSRIMTEEFTFDANAFPRDWYVKTTGSADSKGLSWSAPATLSAALENAVSGSTIHIAAGTYSPENYLNDVEGASASDEFKSFAIMKNVALVGGYPADAAEGAVPSSGNETVLDGGNKSFHTVVVGAPVVAGEKVSMSGLTIRGGANDAEMADYSVAMNERSLAGNYGAGMAVLGSVIDMNDVTVTGNNGNNAAGLFCIGSKITMTGCSVTSNISTGNGAGAWFTTDTDLVMDGCTISGNATNGGIVGALYLYVPADAAMKADIRNTVISDNAAKKVDGTEYNQGGVYVRDDSGSMLLESSFTNCTFSGNKGGMGAALTVLNAKSTFTGCKFTGNRAENSNGQIYVNTSSGADAVAVFDGCTINGNYAKGLGSGIYVYNNGGAIDIHVLNSAFYDNTTGGRGGALYARNNQSGEVNVTCVNSTFSGNTAGSWGGAINLYGAAAKPVCVNLISCTVTDNETTNTTYKGGVSLETDGTTLNTWNSIIAGNMTDGSITDVVIASGKNGVANHYYTFVGDLYYNAEGVQTAVSPIFDYATMIGGIADNGGATMTCKLTGDASSNPAFGNGMPASELAELADGTVSAAILSADQNGNARTDADRIAGACCVK